MPEAFDPYYTWLGIAPDEQPPDHYRLLGIRRFEDNPDVIDNAADRQMAHLRTFATGARAAESQRLLNEVAAARVCLLDASKKSAYDGELRDAIAAAQARAAMNAPPPVSRPLAPTTPRQQPMTPQRPVRSAGCNCGAGRRFGDDFQCGDSLPALQLRLDCARDSRCRTWHRRYGRRARDE
jgi:hypothetical protein